MTELSLAQKGRMIAALRRNLSGRYNTRRRWSDDQIRAALQMTGAEFRKAIAAYEQEAPHPPYSWDGEKIRKAVVAWAIRKRRWPTSKDLDDRAERTLPSSSTVTRHFPYVWGSTAEGAVNRAVQRIVTDDALFERLTPQLVLGIRNVTVRREAMLKYGVERLLREGGAELVQQDDSGKLWRMPSDNSTDAHAQWVEVVNATAEPDGSHAHFFLRVPPNFDTAHEAVAWTFESDELDVKVAS